MPAAQQVAGDELGQARVDGGEVIAGLFDVAVEQAMFAAVVGLLRDEGANLFGQFGRGAVLMRVQGVDEDGFTAREG
jgi:hypothetical protein